MRRVLVAAVVLALLAGTGAWWRLRTPATAGPTGATAPAANAPIPAAVEFAAGDLVTVGPVTLSRTIPLTGTLRPVTQAMVRTKVAGELRDVPVREGMAVTRGQVVARIDPLEFQVRVQEREAQLAAATAQVDQSARVLENTRQLHAREFISKSALDAAQSAWEVAVGNRDAARAQLALARKALADTTLTSPIDGVVAERYAQPGEKLPVDGRVMSVVDLSQMEIEAPVPAAEVGAVRVGQSVALRVEGVAAAQTGQIARIAPATQAGTRSVPVYIALPNRDPAVRAGLFAQGRLTVERRENVLAVPLAAVRDAAARQFVYAVVDGRVAERDIATGLRDETAAAPGGGSGMVEVTRGLSAGDRVVAVNLGTLRSGSAVRIAGEAGAARADGAAPPAPR